MQAYMYLLLSVPLGAVGQVLMKWGAMLTPAEVTGSVWHRNIQMFTNAPILSGLGLYAVSVAFWICGLRSIPLSKAYPMVAGGYIIVFVLAAVIFHEPVTLPRMGGLALIVLGVLVLAIS
ncbi:SMR family transporter [Paenibacillus sp.]|uniref:SMR family transporter n=1 Tax=Paenibacillus sp. TaxID=58172 RepID=UPI003563E365